MAKYNTFAVMDCNAKKLLLVTSSARKADSLLQKGTRIEVWSENAKATTIYDHDRVRLGEYIRMEREYIRNKQARATQRNKKYNGRGK